jgi:hypothetical protein
VSVEELYDRFAPAFEDEACIGSAIEVLFCSISAAAAASSLSSIPSITWGVSFARPSSKRVGDPPLDTPFPRGELVPEPVAAGADTAFNEILVLFRDAGRLVDCCCHCETMELFRLLPGSGSSIFGTSSCASCLVSFAVVITSPIYTFCDAITL